MPREQALGEIDQLDQRADVFGLGAILCEILTGKPPFVAEDSVQVFRMASRGKLDACFERLDTCDADPDLVCVAKIHTEHEVEPDNKATMAIHIWDVKGNKELAKLDAGHIDIPDHWRLEGFDFRPRSTSIAVRAMPIESHPSPDDPTPNATLFDAEGHVLKTVPFPWLHHWHVWQLNHDGSIAVSDRDVDGKDANATAISMWNLDREGPIVDLFRTKHNEQLVRWANSPTDSKVAGLVRVRLSDDKSSVRDELRIWDQTTLEEQSIVLPGQVPQDEIKSPHLWMTWLAFSSTGEAVGVFTQPLQGAGQSRHAGWQTHLGYIDCL